MIYTPQAIYPIANNAPMTFKRTSLSVIVAAALMAMSSGMTYLLCTERNNNEIADLKQQITKLQAAEREAVVTKRISEQMGDIAMEQKLVSDRQRERAEEQSRVADIERGKAELERGLAVKAQHKAIVAARQADSMRVVADGQREKANRHMEEALVARAHADTSFYCSLGRSLAQTSIAQSGTQNRALAPLLAYSSYYFTKMYQGNLYQQDIFTALLNNANSAQQLVTHLTGSIRDMVRNDNSLIVVSDYGELALITPCDTYCDKLYDSTTRLLINDNTYNFRQVCVIDNTAYALDCNGTLVIAPLSGTVTYTPVTLPKPSVKQDHWAHLFVTDEGNLLAANQHQLCLLDNTGTMILGTRLFDNGITCIGKHGSSFYVFDNKHNVSTINGENLEIQDTKPFDVNELTANVTAYHYVQSKKLHILGLDNGTIYTFTDNMQRKNIRTAHTSPITQIQDYGWCVVTTAYDHTLRLWNLENFNAGGAIVPSKVEYRTWPLAIASNADKNTLYVGLASGNVKTLSISVDKNAQETRNNITREFTPAEWEYFIGSNVPYRTFK